jgi:hypothetical protein
VSEKDWYGKRTEAELLAELDQDFDREVYGAHLFDMPSPEEAKKASRTASSGSWRIGKPCGRAPVSMRSPSTHQDNASTRSWPPC